MSWSLASFLLLGAALAAGFAWYERSHASARVVALVGTLGALAALGRIAFAPLPNVKPTTDIVLIAGYALGGAPGFAVGAVAALTSNLFFGQGPWTPWEMTAWGMVGILGAGAARLTGRRLGRIGLAAVCAVASLAYGVVMDLFQTVTFSSGDELVSRFLVFSGTSLWWNVAHAVGSVGFALLFGPALVRALARFRARLTVTWRPEPVVAGALLVGVVAVLAAAPPAARAASPASYLARAQNADGGFGSAPGRSSDQLDTGWAALGVAATGRDPATTHRGGGRSLLAFLRGGAGGLAADTGALERTILVLGASGLDPRRFAGHDLVAGLRRRIGADGSVRGQVNLTSFGILALRAAGAGRGSGTVARAGAWLARQQNRGGGFSFARRGSAADVDDTGAAVQALVAAGRGGGVGRAVRFLRRHQNADGGFPLQPGQSSNAQSTAWAVQGLVAAGVDTARVRRGAGRSPLGYLTTLTAGDGSVRYSRTSSQTPVWVTAQATLALERKPFPLAPVGRPRRTTSHAVAALPRARSSAIAVGHRAGRRHGLAPPSSGRAVGRRLLSLMAMARRAGTLLAVLTGSL